MRRLLCVLFVVVMCLCVTSCDDQSVVGVWGALEPSAYHFDLREDGTCVMFDENDEWVSAGTYTAFKDRIEFHTDTGEFTWVWDKETCSMLFEAGENTFHYRR